MTPAYDLRQRVTQALARPVPPHVLQGDVRAASHYKDCCAQVGVYLRTGRKDVRVMGALVRLESMQGFAPGAAAAALLNGQSGAGML